MNIVTATPSCHAVTGRDGARPAPGRPAAQSHRSRNPMKGRHIRPVAALPCLVATCVLFPTEARADAINFGFVAVAGVAILVPLTIFTVLLEGLVLALGLRIPYKRTLRVVLSANLASLAAGIPVEMFNSWMYSRILPRPLAPYFRQYPYAV